MSEIIGKTLKSTIYGEGIITNEEDGVVWVDFQDAQKQNVCFHATASFSGDTPFLTSDDETVLAYIQKRIQIEKDMRTKQKAVQSMKKLRIDDKYIDAFLKENKIYIFQGPNITEVSAETNNWLYENIKWFERTYNEKAYAVFPIPDMYGNRIFTYSLLCEHDGERGTSRTVKIRGVLACAVGFSFRPHSSEYGEDRPLAIQITDNGIWALPQALSNVVMRQL